MVEDRTAQRAAVEAGYASLSEYVEQWGHEVVSDTQKRYADDVTLQELVRLRVENERLREALRKIETAWDQFTEHFNAVESHCLNLLRQIARSALQQKESE